MLSQTAIEAGHCYRTATGELRLVLGIKDDVVTFAVLFSAGGWTSQGPAEKLSALTFSNQVDAEMRCPAVTPPSWP